MYMSRVSPTNAHRDKPNKTCWTTLYITEWNDVQEFLWGHCSVSSTDSAPRVEISLSTISFVVPAIWAATISSTLFLLQTALWSCSFYTYRCCWGFCLLLFRARPIIFVFDPSLLRSMANALVPALSKVTSMCHAVLHNVDVGSSSKGMRAVLDGVERWSNCNVK